ncbi:MAG: polysaccharide deacetylase family protein [Anaerolineae bacterium]|nr:polysaccharide deacetylase family protein [Anaerolineae bacterium]
MPLILFYHSVSENIERRIDPTIVVHPTHFEQQLRYLSSRMQVISLGELIEALRQRRKLSPRTVVITFDDGYKDNFTAAYPLLQQYHLPATFFLSTGFIGTGDIKWEDRLSYILNVTDVQTIHVEYPGCPDGVKLLNLVQPRERSHSFAWLTHQLSRLPSQTREQVIDTVRELAKITTEQLQADVMLNWDEVREMVSSPICVFGSHAVSHERLSTLPDEQIYSEITGSRREIEQETDHPVSFFAYPYGTSQDFDRRAVSVLNSSGFKCAVTTVYAHIGPNSELFRLGRVLGADTTGFRFSVGTAVRASFLGQSIRSFTHLLNRFVV